MLATQMGFVDLSDHDLVSVYLRDQFTLYIMHFRRNTYVDNKLLNF